MCAGMVNRITDGVRTLLSNNPSTGRSLKELAKSPFLYGRVEPTSSGNTFGASEARDEQKFGEHLSLSNHAGTRALQMMPPSVMIDQLSKFCLVVGGIQMIHIHPNNPFHQAKKKFNKNAKHLRKHSFSYKD